MTAFAEAFSEVFAACGERLVDNATGMLPQVLILLTLFNTISHLIGAERIERFSMFLAKHRLLAYTALPLVSWFLLCNPMVYSGARFLPQRQRASYIDVCATTNGPMLSLFPHVNPGELFIWWGIASGVEALGYSVFPLAVRFLIAGWVLALLRAYVTEGFWVMLAKREGLDINRPATGVPSANPQEKTDASSKECESSSSGNGGILDRFADVVQLVGGWISVVINAIFCGGKQAVQIVINNVLPFLIFISFATGIIAATGVGDTIAGALSVFTGSIGGLLVFSLIIGLPVVSSLLAPGAAVPSILGSLIGSMIASGRMSVSLALPALFAVGIVDTCDFIPVAASLSETEPDTVRVAVPAILFSRFLTAPVAILVGVVATIGLF